MRAGYEDQINQRPAIKNYVISLQKTPKKTKQNKKICKQTGVSTLTVKRMQGENDADIKEHLFCCHLSCFGNFFIFSTALRWGSLSKKISKKRTSTI